MLLGVVLLQSTIVPAFGEQVERGAGQAPSAATVTADVVVYGGTPGGIVAAVAARRNGARVVLVEPRSSIGGMMSNGLSWTDVGDAGVIGGIAAEFFDRTATYEGTAGGRWAFQPSTADRVFAKMLADAGVTVLVGQRLAGVDVVGGRILAIRTLAGNTVTGDVFVDASYEGDLMAGAGVSSSHRARSRAPSTPRRARAFEPRAA